MNEPLKHRVSTIVIDLFLNGDHSIPLDAETNIVTSGICDSLGLVQLAATLESHFPGLRIQDQDITHENMGSVRAIASFITESGILS